MPGLEDFGMVMVEAMAFGKPVIAYRGGGALEIVRAGKNGEFFDREDVRSLMDAMRLFEQNWARNAYQPRDIFASVERFDESRFTARIRDFIAAKQAPDRAHFIVDIP
jgi:glycosyltransferase involved in cell wall biosynthesis